MIDKLHSLTRKLQSILLTPHITSFDEIREQLKLLKAEVGDLLRSVGWSESDLLDILLCRQLYLLVKWMSDNPAFIVDFFYRILFYAVSSILKQKALGRGVALETLDEIVTVAEQFKDVVLWSPSVFAHTRGGVIQLIQGIDQVLRRLDIEKEERKLFNKIKRLLEPVKKLSASEVTISIPLTDIVFGCLPVRIKREPLLELVEALNLLYERVDFSGAYYRHVLSRPIFQGIERPVVDDLDVWKHYWSLLISYANERVSNWGWPSLPPIEIIIYTGTIIENIADAYAYTYKLAGRDPVFVINMPMTKRGSSPADLHLVVHEVTPGHAFHLTFLERNEQKGAKIGIKRADEFERQYPFIPFGVVSLFYEGWAVFSQWIFGARAGTARYNYQWILELLFYLERLAFLVGRKIPDAMHLPRLSDPLQLSSYFFGYLWWRTAYEALRDDEELLRLALFGILPPIDPQNGLSEILSVINRILQEVERIEKSGKIS